MRVFLLGGLFGCFIKEAESQHRRSLNPEEGNLNE